MTKRIVAVILLLALIFSVAGCGGNKSTSPAGEKTGQSETSSPQKGGTFILAYPGDPISFNPDAKIDDFGYSIEQSLYNKLVTLDADYKVIPDLAKSWKVSDDGLTYTFELNRGVKWHDGKPFTSADVKWTLEAIIANKGVAYTNLKVIDKVETPDDFTVVVKLKEPSSPFISFLAWYGTFIMPKHIYEGTDWLTNPANEKPIGTGPFKFVEWKKGDHVTLEANKDYFRGSPYLDKIIYRMIPDSNTAVQALLNGEVDMSITRPPLSQLESLKKAGVKVDTFPAPSRYYLMFNLRRDPLKKLEVRQAIAMAINRKEFVEKALHGLGSEGWGFYTPAIDWAFDKTAKAPPFDTKKAEELLDQAGYKKGADGIRLKLTLPYFTAGQDWTDMAQVIKANLAAIGIDVQLQGLEIAAWSQKVGQNHDFDLALLNGFQGPDPDNMRNRFGKDGSIQFMGYNNPEVDKALDEGAKATDLQKRAEAYHKIQQILARDLPIVPLGEVVSLYVYSNKVHGLSIHPEAKGKITIYDFSKVWLSK